MNAIVTIFESELTDRAFLLTKLESLCSDVKQVGNAYVYSPSPGKLFEFLSVLKFHKVSYGTHFHTNTPVPQR